MASDDLRLPDHPREGAPLDNPGTAAGLGVLALIGLHVLAESVDGSRLARAGRSNAPQARP